MYDVFLRTFTGNYDEAHSFGFQLFARLVRLAGVHSAVVIVQLGDQKALRKQPPSVRGILHVSNNTVMAVHPRQLGFVA